jgi:hypothetical protein
LEPLLFVAAPEDLHLEVPHRLGELLVEVETHDRRQLRSLFNNNNNKKYNGQA